MEDITKIELTGAKRAIESSPKGSLGWYLGCILWNRAVIDMWDRKIVEEVGRPADVEFSEEDLIKTPEFDLAQPLRKLN